jgi:hypothetical protein
VNPGELRQCPECGGGWPKDPDHALRGCGWLQGLPRSISPNNGDVEIHDGVNGRNRFLRLELKGAHETWPIQKGQRLHLAALAGQQNWTVRVLRGTTRAVDLYRVTSAGIAETFIRTHVEAVRRAVVSWLNGSLWRDAEEGLAAGPEVNPGHTHGWARVDGLWTCVQDHYAVGHRPDTGCGESLPQFP